MRLNYTKTVQKKHCETCQSMDRERLMPFLVYRERSMPFLVYNTRLYQQCVKSTSIFTRFTIHYCHIHIQCHICKYRETLSESMSKTLAFYLWVEIRSQPFTLLLYTLQTKFLGVHRNHPVRLSIFLQAQLALNGRIHIDDILNSCSI